FVFASISPAIRLSTPSNPWITSQASVSLRGSLDEAGSATIDGSALALQEDFTFEARLTLQEGPNQFTLGALDLAGNHAQRLATITLDTAAPAAPDAERISAQGVGA